MYLVGNGSASDTDAREDARKRKREKEREIERKEKMMEGWQRVSGGGREMFKRTGRGRIIRWRCDFSRSDVLFMDGTFRRQIVSGRDRELHIHRNRLSFA